jgi:NADH dehydrogenase
MGPEFFAHFKEVEMDDRLVTLFGGGGFLGRYVAQQMYRTGRTTRLRIAERDPRRAYYLKSLGAVGQTQFAAVDIRDRERVAAAVRGCDAVVNLIGVLKGDFRGIHIEGARNVAEACAEAGVASLVHISAIGVDPRTPSRYGRTKALGEEAVRSAFPQAVIVRPSLMFGQDDQFVNRFAGMARLLPVFPVIRANLKIQPVYVGDVAKAVAAAAFDPRTHGGNTYELGGPQVLTMGELMQWICDATARNRLLVDLPDAVTAAIASLFGWLPGAPITSDQWLMLQRDNVVSDKAPGLEAFGITPTPLAAVAEGWLNTYRRHGRFAAKSPY